MTDDLTADGGATAVTPLSDRTEDFFICRLVVDGRLGLDLSFDRGLNVIASSEGDNPLSSNKAGKTALVELIQHGLGRRPPVAREFHFASIRDHVERVWLEIEVGGEAYLIERSLQQLNTPLKVRRGTYDESRRQREALELSADEMSGWMLRTLGIPEVAVRTQKGDLDPLSFPLLMRAFVLHQEDSFQSILSKVQPEQRKADVIGFLSGITPLRRFVIEPQLAQAQKQLDAKVAELETVGAFLARRNVPNLEEAQAAVAERQRALAETTEAQGRIHMEVRDQQVRSAESRGRIDTLRKRLLDVKAKQAEYRAELQGREAERERLRSLLSSLEADRKRLGRMLTASELLSTIHFTSCPRCLQEVNEEMQAREEHGRCSLCARPLSSTSDDIPVRVPRSDDIDAQAAETQEVLADVKDEIARIRASEAERAAGERALEEELDATLRHYVAPAVDRIVDAARLVAEREAALAQAVSLLDQAQALESIREEAILLRERLERLTVELREASRPREDRLEQFRHRLHLVFRSVDFPDYVGCEIDRNTLMPYINGDFYTQFGTAYKGLATVCYHLALWRLAQVAPSYMPRLLVVDSPATGDLNDQSRNQLLSAIAAFANVPHTAETRWQIILTTRHVVPEMAPYVKMNISGAEGEMLLRRSYSREAEAR